MPNNKLGTKTISACERFSKARVMSPRNISSSTNAGKSVVNGAELEATLRPMEGLTLSSGLTYTDSHLTEDQPPIHGLFFGTAAFYRGTILGRAEVHPLGVEKSAAAGLALVWFLLPR